LLATAALQTLVSGTTATIEKILWRSLVARALPSDGGGEGMEGAGCSDGQPNLTYVDTFLATF